MIFGVGHVRAGAGLSGRLHGRPRENGRNGKRPSANQDKGINNDDD